MILQRLKNLWRISEYKIDKSPELLDERFKVLTKNVTTVKKKMAQIVKDDEIDIFQKEFEINNLDV